MRTTLPQSAAEHSNFHSTQMAYSYAHASTEHINSSQMLAQPTSNMMDPTAIPFFDFLRDVLYEQPFNPSRTVDPHGLAVLDFCDNTSLEMTDMDFGLLDNWNLDLVGNMCRSTREGSISRPETAGEVAQMRNALVRGWTESPWRWQPKDNDTGYTELGYMPVSSSQAAKMHLKKGDNSALRVSQEKLEQSGRDRLLSSVLSTCKTDSSRNQVAASFPTVELMDGMIHIFLEAHACQVSGWIHFPTFKLNEQWAEWIGTAAAAGAVSTPVPTLRKFGFAVQEAIRLTIPARFEANNTTIQNLGLVQSLILWQDIALWSGNRRKMEIAECHLVIPVTMMRYRGKFQRANYPLMEVDASDEGDELQEKWKAWISREQWKRLVFHCYLREAQVSMTTLTNPCMSYGELTLPLPESRELWFAPTAVEWKSKYIERHSGQTKRPPSLGDLLAEAHKLPANASRLDLQLSISIYLHGFWSMILEYRQILLLNSRHQELVRELQNFQLVVGDWPDMSVQEQVVLHLLQMNLHVSLDDLQLFSGKEGEDQARRVYPVLQQWAASTASRTAVFGAGQILRCAKMFPPDHLNGFYAVAVHHAALALWTYGVVNKANRQQSMTSQNAYGNVYLDDQDSLSVQRFIGFDQGRPLVRGPVLRGAPREASLQDTRACMEISQEILRANVSHGKEATPPIVENLCHLIQQLGDAAWAVGLATVIMSASETVTSTAAIATTAAVVTASIFILSREVLWPRWAKVLRSPLKTTIPRLTKEETRQLVYQPDQFPGARDVETPYGSIRVYEFGPEDGQKVIFVHGITTSCITLLYIANNLDLFGRGYSDGVGDIPHDARLYVTQMLLALASSPLSWTGNESMNIIGYSLGGGIAAHFAGTFPHMVKSLVLLAPSGLIRAERFGHITKFIFSSGVIPERILHGLTSRRLQQPIASSSKVPKQPTPVVHGKAEAAVKVASAEVPGTVSSSEDSPSLPIEQRVTHYVRWMVTHHLGFVPAFMSCIRHAPLTHQQDSWKALAQRKTGTTAVLLAERDEIINLDDYEADGLPLLGGRENVYWKVLPGTHDFVMTQSDAITREIEHLWGLRAPEV
ncbi:C6 and C2H2 transcription factor RegA-like protein [Cordyceps militaris CM01]|uniref:C6 and C2H2 transcription factor RegA-like protein n=1 Tax=Cordyceps militaris (strain CM01) TaxID=983644 RepID=G3J994_CORMM|nr:C6 and C2H2 transcription factor RegA-like protein [Cordyceps militaris CM01]EGX94073.1 C6 and C2H2 transcription factor RegA-like protein [Cordyceps militaris CM01]